MQGQLLTPVLAAHYRVMPGRKQQEQAVKHGSNSSHNSGNGNGNGSGNGSSNGTASGAKQQVHPISSTDGRTFVGFSFNAGLGSSAEMIFYEFAGAVLQHGLVLLDTQLDCPLGYQACQHELASALEACSTACLALLWCHSFTMVTMAADTLSTTATMAASAAGLQLPRPQPYSSNCAAGCRRERTPARRTPALHPAWH